MAYFHFFFWVISLPLLLSVQPYLSFTWSAATLLTVFSQLKQWKQAIRQWATAIVVLTLTSKAEPTLQDMKSNGAEITRLVKIFTHLQDSVCGFTHKTPVCLNVNRKNELQALHTATLCPKIGIARETNLLHILLKLTLFHSGENKNTWF